MSKYLEALQIKFAAEKYQQGLQIVISDKNKHKSVNGGPVTESECDEAVELVNEREDKDTDENAKDFNGGVAHVSLFHIKTGEANKEMKLSLKKILEVNFMKAYKRKMKENTEVKFIQIKFRKLLEVNFKQLYKLKKKKKIAREIVQMKLI
jgi:hypothetical protein